MSIAIQLATNLLVTWNAGRRGLPLDDDSPVFCKANRRQVVRSLLMGFLPNAASPRHNGPVLPEHLAQFGDRNFTRRGTPQDRQSRSGSGRLAHRHTGSLHAEP